MLKDIRKVIEKHFKDILFCISILSLTVIFSNTLAQYIDKLFVSIDLYSLSFIIPFAALVVCIIAYTAYLWQHDFVPSKNLLFATYCFGLVLYRTKLNGTTIFAYADIIFLLYLCQSALLIKHVIRKYKLEKEDNKTNTANGFISDTPVKDPKNDNKGYNGYASSIANKIKESHFENSFAIGINGKWGSGKTSMSNLIERHLKDERDIVTIKFKPWNSNTPDAIIKDFFETLQDELSQYHAALSRLLIRYSRKLTSIDSNIITQTIEYAANYILDLDATNKVYDKINKALKDIDKKIIIYIDDLDRLEQSEIMEVIRLIRNTANFYNTFFIVTYDKDYVNKALKDVGFDKHEKFLEKIFQLEVDLPYYDKGKLREELVVKLKDGLSDKIVYSEIEKEINNLDILDDWLENSRDVTRVVNSLLSNYERVDGFVVFSEFLLIEITRIYNLTLYYKIRNRPKKYFVYTSSTTLLNEFEDIKGERDKRIIEYLFKVQNSRKITTDSLITNEGSINSIRFPIYFQSSDFNALNLKDYYKLYDLEDSEMKLEIDKIISNELSSELNNRMLEDKNFSTKERLCKFVTVILHSIEIQEYYSYELTKHLYAFLKDKKIIAELFNNFEYEFADILNNENIKSTNQVSFILSLYKEYIAIFMRVHGEFRSPPNEDNFNAKFSKYLDKIPINKTLKRCFETLCNNVKTYDRKFFDLVVATHKLLKPNSKLTKEVLSPVKNFIKNKALKSFIRYTIWSETQNLKNYPNNIKSLRFWIAKSHIEKLFTLDEFEKLLTENVSDPYIEEYKGIFDKSKIADFGKVILYEDFNNIPIEDWINEMLASNY